MNTDCWSRPKSTIVNTNQQGRYPATNSRRWKNQNSTTANKYHTPITILCNHTLRFYPPIIFIAWQTAPLLHRTTLISTSQKDPLGQQQKRRHNRAELHNQWQMLTMWPTASFRNNLPKYCSLAVKPIPINRTRDDIITKTKTQSE